MSLKPMEVFAVGSFFLAGLVALKASRKAIVALLIAVGLTALGVSMFFRVESNISIFMETDLVQLPINIPPRSTLNLLAISKDTLETPGSAGFLKNRNDGPQEQQWPTEPVLKRAVTDQNLVITAWRCEVRNRGTTNVEEVSIPIRFGFGNDRQEFIHKAIINPLTVTEPFVFYIVNNSSVTAHGVWPETISCKVLGEKTVSETRLNRPRKNSIEKIMIFGRSMAPLCGGWE
jgi:hypothetical protein